LGFKSSKDDREEKEIFENELRGTTLAVYWFMLKQDRPLGAREIQRELELSSSSLSLYHLDKLMDLGLVHRDRYGSYLISRRVKAGLLHFYSGSGRLLIPRFAFYAVFTSALLISSLVLFYGQFNAPTILLLLSLSIATIAFWFETIVMLKSQPF